MKIWADPILSPAGDTSVLLSFTSSTLPATGQVVNFPAGLFGVIFPGISVGVGLLLFHRYVSLPDADTFR